MANMHGLGSAIGGMIPTEEENYQKIDQRFWNNFSANSVNFNYEGGNLTVNGSAGGAKVGVQSMDSAWGEYIAAMNGSGIGHLANYQQFRQKYEEVFDGFNLDLKNKMMALEDVWNVPQSEIRELINTNPELSQSMYKMMLSDPSIGDAFQAYIEPQKGALSVLGGLAIDQVNPVGDPTKSQLVPGLNVGMRGVVGGGLGALRGALGSSYIGEGGALGRKANIAKGLGRGLRRGLGFGGAAALTEPALERQSSAIIKQLTKGVSKPQQNRAMIKLLEREFGEEFIEKMGKKALKGTIATTEKLTGKALRDAVGSSRFSIGPKQKAGKDALKAAQEYVKKHGSKKLGKGIKNTKIKVQLNKSKNIIAKAQEKFLKKGTQKGATKSIARHLTTKGTKKIAQATLGETVKTFIKKKGAKQLIKTLGMKQIAKLGIGGLLTGSGFGTAIGIGMTAWTIIDVISILKDAMGESSNLYDEGGVSQFLKGGKQSNLLANRAGNITTTRRI